MSTDTASPLGSLDPRLIDEAIRQSKLDLYNSVNELIGLLDVTNGMNRTPVIDGTNVKSLRQLSVLIASVPTVPVPLTVGKLVKATAVGSIGDCDSLPFQKTLVTIAANGVHYGIDPRNAITLITTDNNGRIGTVLGTASIGGGFFYKHTLILRATAGFTFPFTLGGGLVFNSAAPTVVAVGKQIALEFFYDDTLGKSYELCRSAEVSY